MDAKTFIEKFGTDEATRVAVAAGTNYSYFSQIAHGHRRPSVQLADRLVEASGSRLSFEALMRSKRDKPKAGTTAGHSKAA
ncbi:transcriptional regulator [Cupriavidus necator]|uniref:HTH cro/C1-type domain-containing protein n=1 Tax=Cupriavidus pinatubonensis (strain JMP 134 / LMG 1197) TaxID=264198 RepID=Q46YP0_CUPPJ|nr:transcriptional regulator [Cupriavidus necator]